MRTRKVGSLQVSVLGLGCSNFGKRLDERAAGEVVRAALDAGVTFFDTADRSGSDAPGDTLSEEFLGRALGSRRKDAVVATKFGQAVRGRAGDARPESIHRAVEDSLRRLDTDVIDLYQLHTPDPSVPIGETLAALDDLVRAGKVREIGCCNFSGSQLRQADEAVHRGSARFVSVQDEYNLLHREPEAELLGECARLNVAFLSCYPLASGLLTGKYRQGQPLPEKTQVSMNRDRYGNPLAEQTVERVEQLLAFAESRGHTLLDLAFSWLLQRPVVASVIAKVHSPAQVRAHASASEWELSSQELEEVDRLLGPRS